MNSLIFLLSKGLSSLLQHYNLKASILQCSAFFTVQLSHPHITTGKTIVLTIRTFVGNVMSLLFNRLSRFVIFFLPRSKHLLISWLQSPSAVIVEPKKIKSVDISTVSPSICHEVMGLDAMIFVFWMLNFKPVLDIILCSWLGQIVTLCLTFQGTVRTVFWKGCTISHSQKQCMKVLISPHFHQYLLSSVFLTIVNKAGVK